MRWRIFDIDWNRRKNKFLTISIYQCLLLVLATSTLSNYFGLWIHYSDGMRRAYQVERENLFIRTHKVIGMKTLYRKLIKIFTDYLILKRRKMHVYRVRETRQKYRYLSRRYLVWKIFPLQSEWRRRTSSTSSHFLTSTTIAFLIVKCWNCGNLQIFVLFRKCHPQALVLCIQYRSFLSLQKYFREEKIILELTNTFFRRHIDKTSLFIYRNLQLLEL